MAQKLYKRTEWYRATVDERARVIIAPEEGAPANSLRRIHIFVPASPNVQIGLDSSPRDIAESREYLWPQAPSGQTLSLEILPEQFLSAVSVSSYAEVSIAIEYVVES